MMMSFRKDHYFFPLEKYILGIFLCSLLIYCVTLAPDVLWGDDAQYQRLANGWKMEFVPRGHIVYSYLVKSVNLFPFSNTALKVNFFSAFWASLTLVFLFLITLSISGSKFGGILAVLVFSLSHTFWLHAVRAEVHTLQLFLITFSLYLLIRWFKSENNKSLVFFSFLMIGISLANHILSIALLPAMFYLILQKRDDRRIASCQAILGLLPGLTILLFLQTGSESVFATLLNYLYIKRFHLIVPKNLFMFIAFFFYQFLLSSVIGFSGLRRLSVSDRKMFIFLNLIFLGNILEVIVLPIRDQYVLFLPAFLVFSIFIGLGFSYLVGRSGLITKICLILLLLILPVIIYRITPDILSKMNINLLSIRTLQNRNNFKFFLFPPKNGYRGAGDFARETLEKLPQNSLIISDFTIAQALLYVQQIENFRPDVMIKGLDDDQTFQDLIEQYGTNRIFIADNNSYYPVEEIGRNYSIIPFRYVFRLDKIAVKQEL